VLFISAKNLYEGKWFRGDGNVCVFGGGVKDEKLTDDAGGCNDTEMHALVVAPETGPQTNHARHTERRVLEFCSALMEEWSQSNVRCLQAVEEVAGCQEKRLTSATKARIHIPTATMMLSSIFCRFSSSSSRSTIWHVLEYRSRITAGMAFFLAEIVRRPPDRRRRLPLVGVGSAYDRPVHGYGGCARAWCGERGSRYVRLAARICE